MTSVFAPVVPPGWGDSSRTPQAVLASVDVWVGSAPLGALVRAFGGTPPAGTAAERLDWMEEFSAEHWDFRTGRERNLARSAVFDEPTTRLILDAADALCLTGSRPPARSSYTHLLILGGMVRACLLRPRYAADLLHSGLRVGSVSALSAYRPLQGDENDLIETVGLPGKRNEMEVMEAGLVAAFDLARPVDERSPGGSGREFDTALVRAWHTGGLPVRLVIAPCPDAPARRANTADTYAYWADACVHLGPKDSILLVTSSIYLPYQHSDAVRLLALPHGCSVETVGIDFSGEHLGALRQLFTPANYLQEVRSAIRGVRALHGVATTMAASASLI